MKVVQCSAHQVAIYVYMYYIYIYICIVTARPYDPMVCPEGSNGVQTFSFKMLRHLHRASVLRFPRRRTLNPT